jgi:hypothetical protein
MFSKFSKSKSKRNRPRRPEARQRQISGERQVPTIFSYHARRNDNYTVSDEDDAGAQRERQNLAASRLELSKSAGKGKRHVGAYIVIVILVVALGFNLVLNSKPKVIVSGDASATIASANTAAYQQKAQQLFGGSFSSRIKLTINTAQIDAAMQTAFPELESVTTTLPLVGKTATMHVVPAKAVLADVIGTGGSTVAVDARGVDISASTGSHVDTSLPRVIDQSGVIAKSGHTVLPRSTVSFISAVLYQLKSQSITVTNVTLPLGGSQLNVSLQGVTYVAKLNLQEDPREQSGALAATIKSLVSQQITPSQYIDVRILGRVYYK